MIRFCSTASEAKAIVVYFRSPVPARKVLPSSKSHSTFTSPTHSNGDNGNAIDDSPSPTGERNRSRSPAKKFHNRNGDDVSEVNRNAIGENMNDSDWNYSIGEAGKAAAALQFGQSAPRCEEANGDVRGG